MSIAMWRRGARRATPWPRSPAARRSRAASHSKACISCSGCRARRSIRCSRTFGTEQGEIRWDIVGEGLGCAGFFVERAEDLGPAIAKAKAAGGPAVVCIRTSRAADLTLPAEALGRFVEVYQEPTGG